MHKTPYFNAHISLVVVIYGPVKRDYVTGMHHMLGVSVCARVF
jgi:hypothetical protein